MESKKTSLYERHIALNAKMVDYSNWLMPLEYKGLTIEHHAVREHVGMFDVSHMGEIIVEGEDATNFVNYIFTNDVTKLCNNEIQYGLMCYEDGGVVDDLLVYKYSDLKYLLVVNAANISSDYEWLEQCKHGFNVILKNVSEKMSEIALQGPKAQALLQELTTYDLDDITFFTFEHIQILEQTVLVSRTGYTGEDGFEIYGNQEIIGKIWDQLYEKGSAYELEVCGLGCRDTLRFEANLPLYGNEISQNINPLEANLGYFVKLDKHHFIGQDALKKQKQEGLSRKIVGLEIIDKGIVRHGYEVYNQDQLIGHITTGYLSPTLNKSIALAIIDSKYTTLDTVVTVRVRKREIMARVVSRRFYTKNYKKA